MTFSLLLNIKILTMASRKRDCSCVLFPQVPNVSPNIVVVIVYLLITHPQLQRSLSMLSAPFMLAFRTLSGDDVKLAGWTWP